MTDDVPITWSVLMPVKVLEVAKSRLAELTGPRRAEFALALACDAVTAAIGSRPVARVIVITDDQVAAVALAALGALVIPDEPRAGLNAALRHGAAAVRGRFPRGAVAALNGDLPALHPDQLSRVLAAAERAPQRAFLADAAGVGTTLLAARAGADLSPGFGGRSRARHLASGAREITLADVPGVRQDVDTARDLRAALALGVGPATAAAAGLLTTNRPR